MGVEGSGGEGMGKLGRGLTFIICALYSEYERQKEKERDR